MSRTLIPIILGSLAGLAFAWAATAIIFAPHSVSRITERAYGVRVR